MLRGSHRGFSEPLAHRAFWVSHLPISAILIAGPTASGKSATAIRLAEILNGAVINADSMQVYEDLRVLTARPGAQEMTRAPHLLFGHVDGMVNYSVALWLGDAEAAIHSAQVQRLQGAG